MRDTAQHSNPASVVPRRSHLAAVLGAGTRLDDSFIGVAIVLGLIVSLMPAFLAAWLVHYRKHDYSDKKHPEGIVTEENIRRDQGEQLGDRLSQLDDKWHQKAFGFFYR